MQSWLEKAILVGVTSVVTAIAVVSFQSWAAVDGNPATDDLPRVIPYEGVIDLDGSPFTGSLDMRFTLYDAPTGGNAVWTEDWTHDDGRALQVVRGRFAANLGSFDGAGLESVIADAGTVYLGIQVKHTNQGDDGWVALSGRQRLNPVPYALWSAHASDLDVGGTLAVDGDSTLGGRLGVTGNTTLSGTLGVAGNTTVGGTLGVTSNATVGGTLGVTGASTLSGGARIDNAATVNGGATINGGATLNNGVRLNDSVTIQGGLTNTGVLVTRGNVSNDQGDVTVGDNLAVTGNVGVQGTLNATGAITYNGGNLIRYGWGDDGTVVNVPFGSRNNWDIYYTCPQPGREEAGSEQDNALLAVECYVSETNASSWTVHSRYKYRNSNGQGAWTSFQARWLLIPH
jgi:hypothetical protein